MALLGPQRQDFLDRYKFYIEPATDDRPYFFRFFKWDAAAELFALREQGGIALLDWSYPLLVATLVQAFAASLLLILAPLAVSRCRRILPIGRVALYFLSIGLAFMFMEIAFIQKFVLFLAHPLYAVAVVLVRVSGFRCGGKLACRKGEKRTTSSRNVDRGCNGLGALSLLYLAILPGLFQALIHLPDAAKIAISVLLIAPLAVCMGIPFPTGMMRLACYNPGRHSLGMGDQWFCLGGRGRPRDLAGYSPGFCRGDSVSRPDLWLGRCRVALRGFA